MTNKNDYPKPSDITSKSLVSSTDFTGMVPALPDDDDHMDAYNELYDVPEQGNLSDLENGLEKIMDEQNSKSDKRLTIK